MTDRDTIRERIIQAAATTLQPLPVSTVRLASLVSEEDYSLREVEDIVSLDPALTLRVLRFANSAAGASRLPIATVRAAVIRMGAGLVVSLAASGVVRAHFDPSLPVYGRLWPHAVAAAFAAEQAARRSRQQLPQESITAALLHDIGKLTLARFLELRPRDVLDTHLCHGLLQPDAEVDLLGIDHAEVGALLIRRWNLPDRIAEGVAHYNAPHENHDVLSHVVHFAHAAAGAALAPVHKETLDRLGFSETDLAITRLEVAEHQDNLETRYS